MAKVASPVFVRVAAMLIRLILALGKSLNYNFRRINFHFGKLRFHFRYCFHHSFGNSDIARPFFIGGNDVPGRVVRGTTI